MCSRERGPIGLLGLCQPAPSVIDTGERRVRFTWSASAVAAVILDAVSCETQRSVVIAAIELEFRVAALHPLTSAAWSSARPKISSACP